MTRLGFAKIYHGAVRRRLSAFGGLALAIGCITASTAQNQKVIIVNTRTTDTAVDRRFAQVDPTNIALPKEQIDARGHQDILRSLVAEQGFAMRPLPRGKKGLTLVANGKLSPSGETYVSMVTEQGLSVKPGERAVLSNVRIDKEKMIFDINGGPDHKHEFLRHIQIGVGGPDMSAPVVQDNEQEPTGARITLTFANYVPNITPAQVKALLAPLISFDMKTPVQAFTDTLPPQLKAAILDHHVLVGMSTEMVLYAMGQPESKSREIEGQMPFEEWIYGHAPQDVTFVRINGNRVIRVEIAKVGQSLAIFTKDEVEGQMTTDGRPAVAALSSQGTRTVQLGDSQRNADTQAPAAPPTLRAPGEKIPSIDDDSNQQGTMNREGTNKPVIFPKDTTKDPARTVDAHPENKKDASQADPNSADAAKKDGVTDSAKPAAASDGSDKATDKPQAAPAKPAQPTGPSTGPSTGPTSNFYPAGPQPAR